MWDVYLAGIAEYDWREQFKEQISTDIKIFDPLVEGFEHADEMQRADQAARELIFLQDKCALAVFYFKSNWKGTNSLLQLGDMVGRGKQVFVCMPEEKSSNRVQEKIRNYCEFNGIPIANSLSEVVIMVEEFLAELELCGDDLAA